MISTKTRPKIILFIWILACIHFLNGSGIDQYQQPEGGLYTEVKVAVSGWPVAGAAQRGMAQTL